ncbi:acyltransferase family protein [Ilumatobacter nonamiensis]|uniref:acyltransferase family protein n=1 Tax=Ilumatobacter nonamiensis TaxID=467093 RepID=UPI0003488E28|nr:acyltransferase family protein [Ilumatobacter nonamiensis]
MSSVDQHAFVDHPSETAIPRPEFREDVQGLRGIAVLLVVLFHAELVFPGGFVGVDVFFVISGFVISRLLFAELRARGTIELRSFYARRVRRIVPVAAVVTVCTLIGSMIFLSPTGAQQRAAETGIAASLFVANFFLAFTGDGYFAASDELNPFTHYWSLSVEEQFYLVMPAMLIVFYAVGRARGQRSRERSLVGGVVLISSVSLLMSWQFTGDVGPISGEAAQRISFYASPTRVWEFCAGVLVALAVERLPRDRPRTGIGFGVGGLAAVLWAALVLTDTTPFPGIIAVVPVAGTVALIVAGHLSGAARRSLSVRPLVFFGEISYSWYLWHWPAIVFIRAMWPETTELLWIGAVATIPLSWWSYSAIEQRYRRRTDISGRRALAFGAACVAIPVAVGYGVLAGAGSGWWLTIPEHVGNDDSIARANGCDQEGSGYAGPEACTFEVDRSLGRILLVGDSHGSAVSDSVVDAGNALGYDVEIWTVPGCPMTLGSLPRAGCADWRLDVQNRINAQFYDAVVISHRSAIYTRDEQYSLDEIWYEELSEMQSIDRWADEIDDLFGWFEQQGIPVVYLENVPEYVGFEPPSIARPFEVPDRSVDEIDERIGAVTAAERVVAAQYEHVAMVGLGGVFCSSERCRPEVDDTFVYWDWNHLSPAAVPAVGPRLMSAIDSVT